MLSHKKIGIESFFMKQVEALEKAGRFSTGRNYWRTFVSFQSMGDRTPVYMHEIDSKVVARYNRFLSEKGLKRNTISFYNRVLRAVYNQAVKEGYAWQSFPFEDVYTGVDVTRKRALSVDMLHKIATLELQDPEIRFARDLFLFSFQARGMSFVDMAFLTHQNVRNGFINYIRKKTGQAISLRLEPWMQDILDRYKSSCTAPYLLPILHTQDPKKAYGQYTLALNQYDRMLYKLGDLLGSDITLSSYSARHSWATIARDSEIPLTVISSGLGHTSENTTRIYLDSLDNSLVDRANRAVWERISIDK